jgi:hypothetical protein
VGELGYSEYLNRPLIQVADFASVYGVSFALVLGMWSSRSSSMAPCNDGRAWDAMRTRRALPGSDLGLWWVASADLDGGCATN